MNTLGDYERVVVLGSKGLLGSALVEALQLPHPRVVALTRDDLDLTDPSTFSRHSFHHALVFDAAARISGDADHARSESRDADQSALLNLTPFNAGSDALEAVRAYGRAFAEKNRCA